MVADAVGRARSEHQVFGAGFLDSFNKGGKPEVPRTFQNDFVAGTKFQGPLEEDHALVAEKRPFHEY